MPARPLLLASGLRLLYLKAWRRAPALQNDGKDHMCTNLKLCLPRQGKSPALKRRTKSTSSPMATLAISLCVLVRIWQNVAQQR